MSDKRKKRDPKKPQPPEQLPPFAPEEHELEDTKTELSPGGVTPPGPPIEAPEPEPKQPLEIGPHVADAGDETHTDVLRVVEFHAADAEEPVSQPPAVPDSASGTQPSLSSDETRTDVFRPTGPETDVREQVFDEREADIETGTDYRPFTPPPPAAPEPPEQELGGGESEEPEAEETGTDAGIPFSVHDADTEDFDEVAAENVDDSGETRTDLGPAVAHFVPAEPAAEDLPDDPPEAESETDAFEPSLASLDLGDYTVEAEPLPDAAPDEEHETEPAPAPEAAPRGPSVLQRLKSFFAPRAFFRGVREDAKAVVASWKSSGQRKTTDLVVDKNADWWRRTLLEIVALFAIVVPIETVITGAVGAFQVHPHPYWLIVLPMAGARGVVAGMLAAAVASLLYVLGAFQAHGHLALFTFEIMMEPILFFGVGFFAGELHDELALRYRKASRRLDEVRERNMQLRQERDVLADANKLLERRIVDQSVQFGNLVVAATRIENAGRNEVFEIALDLVEEHTGAAASVLLLLGDGSIDFLCHNGWPEEELATRLAAARESEFVERVVRDGVAINGFAPDEAAPETGPLCIAPLFDDNGLVKAMLCLDEIPASRLNEASMTIFFGIAEWLNAALVRLAKNASQSVERPAPHTGPMGEVFLGGPDDLGERLRLELERCARYGVPTSFLAIQAPDWNDTTREGIDTIDRFICVHFTGGLRPSDTIYKFGYPGCYLLVLAGTTVEGAEVVRTRLLRRVEYAPSQQVGRIEIFATGPDADAPDLVSLVERVAGRFRGASPLALDGACPVRVAETAVEGNVNDFIRHLRMETSLATRNSFPLSVVGITAHIPQSAEPELLARHILAAGGQTLRPTDGVFAIGPNQCVAVLPCTTEEEAGTVALRLAQAVRARDPNAVYGDIETHVLALGAQHADVSSLLQALAQQGDIA